ncbi:hypothetical protein Tco_1251449 [Tanacetum coccineum]
MFKILLNDLENKGVSIPQAEDSDSDVEEDTMSSSEFLAELNDEFHERALLVNQKRFYKRFGKVRSARKPMDKSNETCFAYRKLGKYKGLKAKIVILTKKIDVMSKGKSEKELVAGVTDAEVASQEEMALFLLCGLVCKAHAIYTRSMEQKLIDGVNKRVNKRG